MPPSWSGPSRPVACGIGAKHLPPYTCPAWTFPSLLVPEGKTKMLSKHATNGSGLAPSFEAGQNRRQKARGTGLHPDYWYPVEYDRAVPLGRAVEVRFWNTSIALYRGADGQLHALENRCAHRQ